MGFKGTYLNKFDEAGRISLPAKMREELKANDWGNSLVVYYAFKTKCLKVVPKKLFDEMEKKILADLPKNEKAANAYRGMFSSAEDLEINGSGRISIPSAHRAKARLEGDCCYIIGVNDKIEVWNKEAWDAEISKIEAELSQSEENFGNDLDYMLF